MIKRKKRLLGPPAAFFTEDEDHVEECDQGGVQSLIPVTIPTNYKNDGLLIVENDIEVS